MLKLDAEHGRAQAALDLLRVLKRSDLGACSLVNSILSAHGRASHKSVDAVLRQSVVALYLDDDVLAPAGANLGDPNYFSGCSTPTDAARAMMSAKHIIRTRRLSAMPVATAKVARDYICERMEICDRAAALLPLCRRGRVARERSQWEKLLKFLS